MELETGDFLVHFRYTTLDIVDESVDLQVVLRHDTRREPIVGIVRSGHGFLEHSKPIRLTFGTVLMGL